MIFANSKLTLVHGKIGPGNPYFWLPVSLVAFWTKNWFPEADIWPNEWMKRSF
jgi:hypothetical protein